MLVDFHIRMQETGNYLLLIFAIGFGNPTDTCTLPFILFISALRLPLRVLLALFPFFIEGVLRFYYEK
jgi:hypothetical protein